MELLTINDGLASLLFSHLLANESGCQPGEQVYLTFSFKLSN